jgi:hypothetical protein
MEMGKAVVSIVVVAELGCRLVIHIVKGGIGCQVCPIHQCIQLWWTYNIVNDSRQRGFQPHIHRYRRGAGTWGSKSHWWKEVIGCILNISTATHQDLRLHPSN